MFMGFTLHFYIIFGTNLLTGGPSRIVVFFLFQCFEEKEYQMESKRNETFGSDLFGTNANLETWSGHQATTKAAMRVTGAPPCLVAPLTEFLLLYISTYPENIEEHHEKLFPPPQPSVSVRSHLGAFASAPLEGESTMDGLSTITKASPMSCE